jgi:endonuclease III
MAKKDWSAAIAPLIKKYRGRQHPLDYRNIYQLLVMVVLSAQDSDKNINGLAPELFRAFPDMRSLAAAKAEDVLPYVRKVRGHRKKIDWLLEIAATIKTDQAIPLTMEELVKLKGIGRKSANVILREAGKPAEGVMVDLHVVRVAPRLGIARSTDPKKIEQEIMSALDPGQWGEAGMAMSFLGRETCRPSHPEHHECIMSPVCEYFQKHKSRTPAKKITRTPSASPAKTSRKPVKTAPTKRRSKAAAKKVTKK